MRYVLTSIVILFVASLSYSATIHVPADQPTIEWENYYGFDGVRDYGEAVLQCNDSSLVFLGRTFDSILNTNDILLVKTDLHGNVQWTKTYGEPNVEEIGYDIIQTADNGFIICGETTTMDNGWDIFIIKLDQMGDTIWTQVYGNPSTDKAYKIIQCNDGGFCYTGLSQRTSTGNAFLAKIDSSGSYIWMTYIDPTSQYSSGEGLLYCNDGGYIIVGSIDTTGIGIHNVLMAKLSSCQELWKFIFRRQPFGFVISCRLPLVHR